MYSFLAAQYAALLRQACVDVDKARQVVGDALQLGAGSRMRWEAAIQLQEAAAGPGMADGRVLSLVARCTAAPAKDSSGKALADRERQELSLRALDCADVYDSSQQLLEAERQHAKQFMLPSGPATAAGRGARSRRVVLQGSSLAR